MGIVTLKIGQLKKKQRNIYYGYGYINYDCKIAKILHR